MRDQTEMIDEIVEIMRSCWDLPSDCNMGELFAHAEILFHKIVAGDPMSALHRHLADVQTSILEMPPSEAYREIVACAVAAVGKAG